MGDLSGKKGLILGVGNQRSIACAVAEQLHSKGAELGLTYLSDPKGRFEANVRSASVIGMVGAGGIGMLLWDAIRSFDYAKTAAIILVIVVVVSVLDFASSRVRRLYI